MGGEVYDPTMAEKLATKSEWLASHPPDPGRFNQTLAGVGSRVLNGEDFRHAIREFLDEFNLLGSDRARSQAIAERPSPTGDQRLDAYLGAMAEHLSAVHGLRSPPWSLESQRFLTRFWFVSKERGFRAVAIAQAPAAFRRRGVFIPERSLHRV
jgi:hypothetical protein